MMFWIRILDGLILNFEVGIRDPCFSLFSMDIFPHFIAWEHGR